MAHVGVFKVLEDNGIPIDLVAGCSMGSIVGIGYAAGIRAAEMIDIARCVRPDCVTLVPERREERTTEGGLDVVGGGKALEHRVKQLLDADLRVSMFIAPTEDQVRASAAIGARQIEIHTGEYANEGEAILATIARAAKLGKELGLEIAAGHGLTTANVPALVRAAPEIVELNIGHAIVADALFLSLAGAVRAMREAMGSK